MTGLLPRISLAILAIPLLLGVARRPNASRTEVIARVTNPTSIAALAVYEERPSGHGPWPAVLVLPGGIKAGGNAMGRPDRDRFTAAGYLLAFFDADGRGASGGSEDFNGPIQQDGMAAVLDWMAKQPDIDPERIGVLSLSMSMTIAAGTLARHVTPARFWVDWEGPPSRPYYQRCRSGGTPHDAPGVVWGACDDETWWKGREAVPFMADLKVPYQRLQTLNDHSFKTAYYDHTLVAMQAVQGGRCPWFRLNDMPPNQPIHATTEVVPLPDAASDAEIQVRVVNDLMGRFGG